MTKHTPGPWVVAEDVFNDRPEIRDRDGRLIAVVIAAWAACEYCWEGK